DDLLATERLDLLDIALPIPLVAIAPGLRDAVVAQLLGDEADQAEHAARHQVVQVAPLVLHLLAEPPRRRRIARVECLDRSVHRRPRHLPQLLFAEPALLARGHSSRLGPAMPPQPGGPGQARAF